MIRLSIYILISFLTINLFAQQEDFKIKTETSELRIQVSGNTYSCTMHDTKMSAGFSAMGIDLDSNGQRVASATQSGKKIDFRDSHGNTLFAIKKSLDKLKISIGNDVTPWELKLSDDKYKVLKGQTGYGKVKFYPETGKLKAKDTREVERAAVKGFTKLSPVLSPYLMTDIDDVTRTWLVLILAGLDK